MRPRAKLDETNFRFGLLFLFSVDSDGGLIESVGVVVCPDLFPLFRKPALTDLDLKFNQSETTRFGGFSEALSWLVLDKKSWLWKTSDNGRQLNSYGHRTEACQTLYSKQVSTPPLTGGRRKRAIPRRRIK